MQDGHGSLAKPKEAGSQVSEIKGNESLAEVMENAKALW